MVPGIVTCQDHVDVGFRIYSGTVVHKLNLFYEFGKNDPGLCLLPNAVCKQKHNSAECFCLQTKLFANRSIHEQRYHCISNDLKGDPKCNSCQQLGKGVLWLSFRDVATKTSSIDPELPAKLARTLGRTTRDCQGHTLFDTTLLRNTLAIWQLIIDQGTWAWWHTPVSPPQLDNWGRRIMSSRPTYTQRIEANLDHIVRLYLYLSTSVSSTYVPGDIRPTCKYSYLFVFMGIDFRIPVDTQTCICI